MAEDSSEEIHVPPFVEGSMPGAEHWAPREGKIGIKEAQEIQQKLKPPAEVKPKTPEPKTASPEPQPPARPPKDPSETVVSQRSDKLSGLPRIHREIRDKVPTRAQW